MSTACVVLTESRSDDKIILELMGNMSRSTWLMRVVLEAVAVAMQEVKAVMVEDTAVVILKEDMVEAIKATDM